MVNDNQNGSGITDLPNVNHSQQPHSQPREYELASLGRIFLARIIDLILIAIPGFAIRFLVAIKPDQWHLLYLNLGLTISLTLLYFVILPFFQKGQTLGKLICGIRLKAKGKKQPSLWHLFLREVYFLFIPWLVAVGTQIGAILIMKSATPLPSEGIPREVKMALLLTQIGYLFYLAWFLYLVFSIKVQDDHQAIVDLKNHLYVVNKDPKVEKPTTKTTKEPKWIPNLASQPGLLKREEKEWLVPDEFGFEVTLEPETKFRKDKDNARND
ncbi:RDD family protein [Entomoplasma freundtii]|uniref:Uncharacterized protein n=1 Tax=Entomoplasma freundtii TaxID=74700 RepID=A0A2K8NS01_9MOLU|nr:RDD family protein [Entomoplasma freundtii]ATZ16632.1 hypothetical protein EFREU_v1c06120 [Entomoplasma freundtii]TDY58201.1 RDD family protein [Entomoplasma freundtii]